MVIPWRPSCRDRDCYEDVSFRGDLCWDCSARSEKICECGTIYRDDNGVHYNTDCCDHFVCDNCYNDSEKYEPRYGNKIGCAVCAEKKQERDAEDAKRKQKKVVEDALKLHDKPFVTRLLKKCKSESLQECLFAFAALSI